MRVDQAYVPSVSQKLCPTGPELTVTESETGGSTQTPHSVKGGMDRDAGGLPLYGHWGQIRPSSIQITVDVYGHLEPGRNRQAYNKS